MKTEDLIPGQRARIQLDGKLQEGAICGFLADGGIAILTEDGEAVTVEHGQIAGVRKTAWQRLCESDPKLAAELLTEELTALLPHEDAGSLLEASLEMTWARAKQMMGSVDQSTVEHIYMEVGKRHPQSTIHEFSAFLRASRASARSPKVNIPTSGGFPAGSGGREGT